MLMRTFGKPLALALALMAAGPAQALTCQRPSVVDSFDAANERPENFYVALGSLTRIGQNVPDGPDTGDINNRVGYSFPAQFDGYFANADGFEVPGQVGVTVEVSCVVAWCGGDSLSDHGLYFFRSDAQGEYALEAAPCPMFFYDNPIEHQLMGVIGMML